MAEDQDDRFPSERMERFIVRMPDGMRDRIKAAADANNRSMNAEIVSKLERYDSLGGEVDAIWEVARALAAEIDKVSGASSDPLVDKINDVFDAVDDFGNVDRAKLGREYAMEASERLNGALSGAIQVPPGLLSRIKAEAEKSNRSMNAVIVATLELAYPAPFPHQRNLKFFYFQWYSEAWHSIDDDSWARFRAGEMPKHVAGRMAARNNYFVVAVIDESYGLVNLIPHNYHLKDGGYIWAADDYLTDEDKRDYNRLMRAVTMTEEDERRIKELRNKMDPAFALPPNAVSKLRGVLKGLAPDDDLDRLLEQVS